MFFQPSPLAYFFSSLLGFHIAGGGDGDGEKLDGKIAAAGVAAARRRFTPEFINRLDHIVVFRSLGTPELRRIVDIELESVQQRIRTAAQDAQFYLAVTESAKEFLLAEGTDARYGARPLKRAIERLLVHPISNLLASRQIRRGDSIRVSHVQDAPNLRFSRESEVEQAYGAARQAA
jgi:ATP-dependent Clp protease ATP-binding subunit ClpB